MDHEVPPGASSSVYFAKVIEPEHEDTHVVRKGDELKLTAPTGKGKFLCWYDALHPEGSGNRHKLDEHHPDLLQHSAGYGAGAGA